MTKTNSGMSEHGIAIIYAFFMSLVAATSAAALKYIGNEVSVEFITFWQFVTCLLISAILLKKNHLADRQGLRVQKADRLIMFIRGISGLLGFYAFYLAVSKIPLIEATLLRHSSPFFVPLIALLWFGIRTSYKVFAFIGFGFVGVYLTLRPDVVEVNVYHLLGLSSALFLALSMVTTNRLKTYRSEVVLFYYFLISFIGMLPVGIFHWQAVSLIQALLILYIGLSIYIAMFLYNKAFTLSDAAHIAPMTYLSIVHAGLLGWLIWGFVPDWLSIVGMLIVVGCGLMTALTKSDNV